MRAALIALLAVALSACSETPAEPVEVEIGDALCARFDTVTIEGVEYVRVNNCP